MIHATIRTFGRFPILLAVVVALVRESSAADLPDPVKVETVKLLEVPSYCEGVVFDHTGKGYISWKDTITQFTLDGMQTAWATTGAPNGHKILADGTHLVCDASHHAVLHLDASGKMLEPASKECDGKPLRGPNDLTLDSRNGGFYFTDPGDSGRDNLTGTVHYVDPKGTTHLVAGGLAYSNGIVVSLDGKRLLVAESQKNRVLEYPILSPGKVGELKVFADLPKNDSGRWEDNQPDGMCLDATGNLYVAHYGMKQVQVLSPEGKLLAHYNGGNQTTSNVAFGGPHMDQLFITGGIAAEGGSPGGLFRIDLKVKGLVILPAKAAAQPKPKTGT
jgi:gluconolactonase